MSSEVFSDELLVTLGDLLALAAARLLVISETIRLCCEELKTELPLEVATVSAERNLLRISLLLKSVGSVVKSELKSWLLGFPAPAVLLVTELFVDVFEAAAAAEWATALSRSEFGLAFEVEDADEMVCAEEGEVCESTEWLGELTVTPERDSWWPEWAAISGPRLLLPMRLVVVSDIALPTLLLLLASDASVCSIAKFGACPPRLLLPLLLINDSVLPLFLLPDCILNDKLKNTNN